MEPEGREEGSSPSPGERSNGSATRAAMVLPVRIREAETSSCVARTLPPAKQTSPSRRAMRWTTKRPTAERACRQQTSLGGAATLGGMTVSSDMKVRRRAKSTTRACNTMNVLRTRKSRRPLRRPQSGTWRRSPDVSSRVRGSTVWAALLGVAVGCFVGLVLQAARL